MNDGIRPATYVVPNLASLLLLPISDDEIPRTEFGMQIAKGLAEKLSLNEFCQSELDAAFDLVDDDGNGVLDEDEVLSLLESAYVATYGEQIEQERNNFFRGFGKSKSELTKKEFIMRLTALQGDAEGERKAFGLSRGLNLQELSVVEMEEAFDTIDLDGNGLLDEDEFQSLLEDTYISIYGKEIEKQRADFFAGFQTKNCRENNSQNDYLLCIKSWKGVGKVQS